MVDFNQYIRQKYIVQELKQLSAKHSLKNKKLRIIDVGAGIGTSTNYLKSEFKCSVINIELAPTKKLDNLIIADGRYLPFIDSTFDFCISSDVLEHIKHTNRAMLLKELVRCAKIGTLITFSKIHTKNPQQAAIKLFEAISPKTPQWYKEHNSNLLVDIQTTMAELQNNRTRALNKPISGFFAVFFTGILLNTLRNKHLRAFLNITCYLIAALIDKSPFYSFGIIAEKI